MVGIPVQAKRLRPEWIGIAPTLDAVPPKAIVLVDEVYLRYHARGSMAAESLAMSQMVNLSRQREQTLLFVRQEARRVDRNIASSTSVLVFKEPGDFQIGFERRELPPLVEDARAQFHIVRGHRRG